MTSYPNPPDEEIKALLQRIKHIAVVGLSPKPDRPSYFVARALLDWGYAVTPVRPATDEVLGRKAWPDLQAVPEPIDLVDIFLNPSRVDAVVDTCIALGLPALWLQEGVVNETAAQRAREAGIMVVMDRCIYKEHRRLLGSQD
ncbi:MAG: CoA-binding protein [Gammaproteobacteria bacterium]|nr:CoA-binding protein [Gammaproteobacteria bacterium]MDH5650454.1 CoA-binding protein [Gammaproteobacteria bacterium]